MSLETIELSLQPAQIMHGSPQEQAIAFGLLVGVKRASGESLNNPVAHRLSADISATGELSSESITLPSEKADRFIELYKRFNFGAHELDCHDLVTGVEGWGDNISVDNRIIDDDEPIEPGAAYQVLVNAGTSAHPDWVYTHSALGNDEGKLVSAAGKGLPIISLSREHAIQIYGQGYTAHLATVSLAEGVDPQVFQL